MNLEFVNFRVLHAANPSGEWKDIAQRPSRMRVYTLEVDDKGGELATRIRLFCEHMPFGGADTFRRVHVRRLARAKSSTKSKRAADPRRNPIPSMPLWRILG